MPAWDEKARTHLATLATVRAAPGTKTIRGMNVDTLVQDLRHRGFGGVQPETVAARLDEVAALIEAAKGVERVLRESRDCDCVTLAGCRFLREERTKVGQPAEAAIAGVRRHSRSQATRSAAGRAGLT